MKNNPADEFTLPEQDVRKIVNLLGRIIAAPGDLHEKRRLLMDGLCGIIDARAWIWGMWVYLPDEPPTHVGLIHSGFDDERFVAFMNAANHPDMERVARHSNLELQARGVQLTRTRHQMDPQGLLADTAAGACWRKADIDDLITSMRPMAGGGVSGIGIYRELDKPHFTERETKIAHIILSEVPWLHFHAFPDKQSQEITNLYPRHRTVLNCLCEGWPRKKIADHLGLSTNTIHGYSKAIFKHFGVHSQSELVARFAKGDGGDR